MTMIRFSVVLTSALCFSAALSAQQSSCGPICASLMDDAKRLAWVLPAGDPGDRATEVRPFQAQPAPADSLDSQWRHVRELAAGTVIVLTVQGSPAVRRRFVSANASALAVEGSDSVRTEMIGRADIVEIRAPKARSIGRKVGWGIAGYFLGGMAGGL